MVQILSKGDRHFLYYTSFRAFCKEGLAKKMIFCYTKDAGEAGASKKRRTSFPHLA
jgi:hypothetical protein